MTEAKYATICDIWFSEEMQRKHGDGERHNAMRPGKGKDDINMLRFNTKSVMYKQPGWSRSTIIRALEDYKKTASEK